MSHPLKSPQHLILGYGYSGYYLAQEIARHQHPVVAVSRQLRPEFQLPGLMHQAHDLHQRLDWLDPQSVVYYLTPPPTEGDKDTLLADLLGHHTLKAKKVIYFSSTGVYGTHHNAWVDEQAICHIENPRQQRRLHAEQLWFDYCQQQGIELVILRVAGIYGPQRLPLAAAQVQTPLIAREQAPLINHVFVKDLAKIAYLLGQMQTKDLIFNVADGHPRPIGSLQAAVAEALSLPPAPYQTWDEAWQTANPMKQEFMRGSKRLNIERLTTTLGPSFSFTPMHLAVQESLGDQ